MTTEKRGRKTLRPELKKIAVNIYVEKFIVDYLGGMNEAQNNLHNYLKENYEKKAIRHFKLETRG